MLGRYVDLGNPVDWGHPLNQGRALWLYGLPGWAGGGTWLDITGRGNGGALTNGPTWTPSPRGDTGLTFDGSTQYAQVTPQPVADSSPQSCAAWVYLSATPSSNRYAVTRGSRSANWSGGLWVRSAGTAMASIIAGGVEYDVFGAATLGAGWHRLVWTWDTATLSLYVDGLADGTPAATSGNLRADSVGWLVGHSYTPGEFWPGPLADVSVWSRALSAAEVALDYDLSRQGYPAGLRRYDFLTRLAGATAAAGFKAGWATGATRIIGTGVF